MLRTAFTVFLCVAMCGIVGSGAAAKATAIDRYLTAKYGVSSRIACGSAGGQNSFIEWRRQVRHWWRGER